MLPSRGNRLNSFQLDPGHPLADSGDFPKVILLDTVSFCNLRCSMCFHKDMKRQRGFMSEALYAKIIAEVAQRNPRARVWLVFFGEPFILKNRKPSIFDMISHAKQQGLEDVVLNSNANLMDEAASRSLIQSGLDAIYIGLDAFSPEVYAKIRVGGDYARTVANVRALLRLKAECGAQKPAVYVQFVEMDANAHEKEAFVEFWQREGANVKIRPKVSWAGMVEAPNLVLGNEARWPCYWAMQTMSITDTGKVVTCAVDLDAHYVAGDVSTQSLSEVWNGGLRALRECHLQKRWGELPPSCAQCRDWQSARADYY